MYLYNGIALLENDSHICKWVVENNRLDFDQNTLPRLLPFIKKGDVVLDAGANIGAYSFAFLNQIGNQGMLYAFEPSEETFECLEHNLRSFENAQLFNNALSYKKGYVKIVRENDNVGMNFCEEVTKGSVIKSLTIDSLKLPALDFIKIDVEGDELNVLIGGYETIKKHKPIMFIEINSHTLKRKGLNKLDIFNWLDKNNYSYSNIFLDQHLNYDQFDIICIHNDKL